MSKAKVSKPTPNAWEIYQLAERYYEASHILKEHGDTKDIENEETEDKETKDDILWAYAPQIFIDSFAIELYLKCLYVLDTNTIPPKGHKWEMLFTALASYMQASIRDEFNLIVAADPILFHLNVINPEAFNMGVTDFDRSLQAASSTFQDHRYLYESQTTGEWFYTHLVRDAVRGVTARAIRLAGLSKS